MASKRRLRRKSCGNKVKYSSIKDAKRQNYFMNKNKSCVVSNQFFAYYKCSFCGFYHIGHSRLKRQIRDIKGNF